MIFQLPLVCSNKSSIVLFLTILFFHSYEDGETIFRKVSSAADFIWSESPLEILGSVTSISFDDPASLPIKEHSLTTEEVISSSPLYSYLFICGLLPPKT